MTSESKENLYLIGFMGTGKSAIGRRLASLLGYQFLDVDECIEQEQERSISDIFAQEGEAAFRSMEKAFIERGHPPFACVVSCGGGLVTQEGLLATMQKKGVVICLTASAETVYERVKDSEHRPLLQTEDPLQTIRDLMACRIQYYQQADNQVMTDQRSLPDVVDHVLRTYRRALVLKKS